MSESDDTQSAHEVPHLSECLQQATALCNELDELMTLHHFFYQAAEHFFEDKTLSFKRGLSLFPSWLRERDINVLEATHRLQEVLRAVQRH